MVQYPKDLLVLIAHLKKLPGVGRRTAERYAFHLLGWEEKELGALAEGVATLRARVSTCSHCGCLMEGIRCLFCDCTKRECGQLCVVAHPRDTYAIEETGTYCGLYHVLGTLLSPLEGKTVESLQFPRLQNRVEQLGVKEVIIALDPTLEGDATALYLGEQLKRCGVEVSRLALGLPLGSSLDFVDEGTLSQALMGRRKV